MNVTCPECSSVFRVDPAKIPLAGVRARCSVCGGVIAHRRARSHRRRLHRVGAGAAAAQRRRRASVHRSSAPLPPRPPVSMPTPPQPMHAGFAAPSRRAGASSRRARPRRRACPRGHRRSRRRAIAPAVPAQSARRRLRARPPSRPATSAAVDRRLRHPQRRRASAAHVAVRAARRSPQPVDAVVQRTRRRSGSSPAAPPARRAAPIAPAPAPAPAAPQPAPPQPARRPHVPLHRSPARRVARPPINPFLANDPNAEGQAPRARARLGHRRVLSAEARRKGMRDGTLRKQLFREEIKKSYEEYVEQMGRSSPRTRRISRMR